ncbi:hypothetical protein ACLOJK_026535 [Asimina triloba]
MLRAVKIQRAIQKFSLEESGGAASNGIFLEGFVKDDDLGVPVTWRYGSWLWVFVGIPRRYASGAPCMVLHPVHLQQPQPSTMTAAVDDVLLSGRPTEGEHPVGQSKPPILLATQLSITVARKDDVVSFIAGEITSSSSDHHPDLLRRWQRQAVARTDPGRPSHQQCRPDPAAAVPAVSRCRMPSACCLADDVSPLIDVDRPPPLATAHSVDEHRPRRQLLQHVGSIMACRQQRGTTAATPRQRLTGNVH